MGKSASNHVASSLYTQQFYPIIFQIAHLSTEKGGIEFYSRPINFELQELRKKSQFSTLFFVVERMESLFNDLVLWNFIRSDLDIFNGEHLNEPFIKVSRINILSNVHLIVSSHKLLEQN